MVGSLERYEVTLGSEVTIIYADSADAAFDKAQAEAAESGNAQALSVEVIVRMRGAWNA